MISDHVPTLDRCQRLKELEVPQETEFSWYRRRWSPMSAWEDRILRAVEAVRDSVRGHEVELLCTAPLATEMLKWLPSHLERDREWRHLELRKIYHTYHVGYDGTGLQVQENTAANALADLLIWCVEQGHVRFEEKAND